MFREGPSTRDILAQLRSKKGKERTNKDVQDTPKDSHTDEPSPMVPPTNKKIPTEDAPTLSVEDALNSGDALLAQLVATVAENHNAASRPGSSQQPCATCRLFKTSRDELMAHVSNAFDEVRRLRHQYDICKERLVELEGEGDSGTGGESNYQLKQHVALLEDRCNAMQERMRIKDGKAKAMETQVQSAKAILRENADLRSQRDQLVQRVHELEGQMDKDIEAAEDAAECKLASLAGSSDPSSSACEAELKELRRLRVLMRFSELKKDSDRLQDVYRYAEELEVEIDRLRNLSNEAPPPTSTTTTSASKPQRRIEMDQLKEQFASSSPPRESDRPSTASSAQGGSSPRQQQHQQHVQPRSARAEEDNQRRHASHSAREPQPTSSPRETKSQLAPLPPSPSTRSPNNPIPSRHARPQSSGGTSSVAWLLGLVREQRTGAARPSSGRAGGIPASIGSSSHQQHYLRAAGQSTSRGRAPARPGTAGTQVMGRLGPY